MLTKATASFVILADEGREETVSIDTYECDG